MEAANSWQCLTNSRDCFSHCRTKRMFQTEGCPSFLGTYRSTKESNVNSLQLGQASLPPVVQTGAEVFPVGGSSTGQGLSHPPAVPLASSCLTRRSCSAADCWMSKWRFRGGLPQSNSGPSFSSPVTIHKCISAWKSLSHDPWTPHWTSVGGLQRWVKTPPYLVSPCILTAAVTLRGREGLSIPGWGSNVWPLAAKYYLTLRDDEVTSPLWTLQQIKFFGAMFSES